MASLASVAEPLYGLLKYSVTVPTVALVVYVVPVIQDQVDTVTTQHSAVLVAFPALELVVPSPVGTGSRSGVYSLLASGGQPTLSLSDLCTVDKRQIAQKENNDAVA